MSDLRVILLVVGCLFIVGIYCWEVFFRSEPKRKNDILDAVDDIPDLPSMDANQADDPQDYTRSLVDLGNMIKQSRSHDDDVDTASPYLSRPEINMPEDDVEPEPVQVISRTNYFDEDTEATEILTESAAANKEEQEESLKDDFSGVDFDLFSKQEAEASLAKVEDNSTNESVVDTAEVDASEEAVANDSSYEDNAAEAGETLEEQGADNSQEQADRKLGQSGDDLVVVYITSPAQTMFNGLSISKAADEVGMIYGHMNVFHHFGPGKLHSGQPLFSMANMFEPGSFDLGRMADLRTKGVVMFMYSPASIEPKVVFELFLNTAQRVAKLLNGEIRTEDNQLLTSTEITSLRLKAEHLSELE